MGRNYYKGFIQPAYIVDVQYLTQGYGVQIAWDRVTSAYASTAHTVTVATGGAAQAATTVPVTALTLALKSGDSLDFGGAKFARLTADAAVGATSLTVAAIPTALVAGDKATVAGSGVKRLKAGTVLSKANGINQFIPRALKGGSDGTASCVLLTDAEEGPLTVNSYDNSGYTGYGQVIGGPVYENLMPDFSNAAWSTFKTELASSGCTFYYQTYSDSRAS